MIIGTGTILGERYRAEELLGRGGMGEVWRCHDLDQETDVAIKALRAEHFQRQGAERLFLGEVTAAARLVHPGIVPVYDLFRGPDGTALLVMAFCRGVRTSEIAASTPPPSWRVVRALLVQILDALAFAHARGILHLDVKPENVLVERRGEALRATLVDFGIARMRHPGHGVERWFAKDAMVGTIEYMAPEQCAAAVERFGPWTDLYSVGAMAFELVSGKRPFPKADPMAAAVRRLTTPPPPLVPRGSDVPLGFADLVAELLAIEPHERPLCAADVIEAVEALDAEASWSTGPRPVTRPASDTRPTSMRDSDVQTRPLRDAAAWARAEVKIVESLDGSLSLSPETPSRPLQQPKPPGAEAESAFTADAELPPVGAYGLFGLRDLPVLGRHHERRALWSAVRSAVVDGRPRFVLLAGRPGVGKSRLARDAAERSVELGLCLQMQTSWSAAGSGDEGLRGLVENLLDTRGVGVDDLRTRLKTWLARIAGNHDVFQNEVRILLRPPLDASPDALLPLRVAVDAIALATAVRPVVVWLDDVQWSRGEADALIRALREREGRLPVCVVATAVQEIDEAPAQTAIGEDMTRVVMAPLDRDASQRMVRGLLDVDDELCEWFVGRAEGNPLFLTQLLQQVVAEDGIERREGRYRLVRPIDARAVPQNIAAVWERRVTKSRARPVDLMALAVTRRRVSLEVCARLAERLGAEFDVSLEHALGEGIVRVEGGEYRWMHGLLCDYLAKSVPEGEEARLRGAAAEALEPLVGREDVQEERARHLSAAGRERDGCEAMLDAAMWSWRHADTEARRDRLLELLSWSEASDFVDLTARALAELAHMDAEAGGAPFAERGIGEATAMLAGTSSEATVTRAWIALRRSQVARLLGKDEEGRAASAEALALARATQAAEVETAVLSQMGLDAFRQGDVDTARGHLRAAIARAEQSGDRRGEAQALRVLADTHDPAEGLAMLDRAIHIASDAGALKVELSCRQVQADMLWHADQRALARSRAAEVAAEAVRRSLRQTAALLELQSAVWALVEGDWTDAAARRESAERWGARSGANVERSLLAGIEAGLACVKEDEAAAHKALDDLETVRAGYTDRTMEQLLQMIAARGSSAVKRRLEAI